MITLCIALNKWASFINFPVSYTMSIGLNWNKLFMYYVLSHKFKHNYDIIFSFIDNLLLQLISL